MFSRKKNSQASVSSDMANKQKRYEVLVLALHTDIIFIPRFFFSAGRKSRLKKSKIEKSEMVFEKHDEIDFAP